MIIAKEANDFLHYIKIKNCSLLGLDVGTKKVGVAVCDAKWSLISPLEVLYKAQISKLAKLIDDYDIKGLIVGWPIDPQGNEGSSCDRVKEFIDNNLAKFNLPIFLQDETLTTKFARDIIQEKAIKAKDKDKMDDKVAASIILENGIHRLINLTN